MSAFYYLGTLKHHSLGGEMSIIDYGPVGDGRFQLRVTAAKHVVVARLHVSDATHGAWMVGLQKEDFSQATWAIPTAADEAVDVLFPQDGVPAKWPLPWRAGGAFFDARLAVVIMSGSGAAQVDLTAKIEIRTQGGVILPPSDDGPIKALAAPLATAKTIRAELLQLTFNT